MSRIVPQIITRRCALLTGASLLIYSVFTCYAVYLLLSKGHSKPHGRDQHRSSKLKPSYAEDSDWNPWGQELEMSSLKNASRSGDAQTVEVWGKAAIGLYVWQHVFNGRMEPRAGGAWSYGFQRVGNIKFKFRTGPAIVPSTVPEDAMHVILILNGRTREKIEAAKAWLEALPSLPKLKKAAAIVLGDEACGGNLWLLPYMASRGGPLAAAFLVYDTALVDGLEFFQWPLGVATYRGFPKPSPSDLDLESERPYLCNFLGTVYSGSSREELLRVLRSGNLSGRCFVKPRDEWQPLETKESVETYVLALAHSDLTLNPVGKNPECYRIYEAMTYGSLPVVEDRATSSRCATAEDGGPFRLLKRRGAPIVYVRNWTLELPALLESENKLSVQQKVERRLRLVRWYEGFKRAVKEELIQIVGRKFFGTSVT